MKSFQCKILVVASAFALLLLNGCGESGSPNNANPAQGNMPAEEIVNIEDPLNENTSNMETPVGASSESSVTASSPSVENTSLQQPKSSDCSYTYKGVSYELNPIAPDFNQLYINFLNDAEIVYGTVHTLRNRYKTVTIGSYEWMAENMIENTDVVYPNTDVAYPYGKLGNGYPWEYATKVCPIGWHLPTIEEWEYLYEYLGKNVGEMQTVGFDGWPNATNGSGLSIIPAGIGGIAIRCPHGLGTKVKYWSGTQTRPWVVESDTAYSGWLNESAPAYYVRCVKNGEANSSSSSSSEVAESSSSTSIETFYITFGGYCSSGPFQCDVSNCYDSNCGKGCIENQIRELGRQMCYGNQLSADAFVSGCLNVCGCWMR